MKLQVNVSELDLDDYKTRPVPVKVWTAPFDTGIATQVEGDDDYFVEKGQSIVFDVDGAARIVTAAQLKAEYAKAAPGRGKPKGSGAAKPTTRRKTK